MTTTMKVVTMLFDEAQTKEFLLEQIRHYKTYGPVRNASRITLLFRNARNIDLLVQFNEHDNTQSENVLPDGRMEWTGPREVMIDKVHQLFAAKNPDAVFIAADTTGDMLMLTLGQPEGNVGCMLGYHTDAGRWAWGAPEWLEMSSVLIPNWPSNPQQSKHPRTVITK